MSVLQVSYDLRAPGRDYAPLHEAIRSYGTWCKPLESTWLIVTDEAMASVRDRLRRHIDQNDGLLVTGFIVEAHWYGLATEVAEWLQKQVSAARRY